jgi:tripeptidyl-peptidase-1
MISYYPKAVGRTIKLVGPDSGNAGVEASLDIEYISTMGGGVETEFWSFAGRAPGNPQNEPFLDFVYLIGNTSDADVPKVFSTSYGEPEDTVGMSYMQRIEVEFMKMGARGITLLFASGDSGVAPDGGVCKKGKFAGQWPAGSPWVTGVGGSEGGSTTSPESAWSGSAGGFSDRWARPAFQTDAVAAYLK